MVEKRARIGVVGVGRWGKNLVRAFDSLERSEVVGICDVQAERVASCQGPALALRCTDASVLNGDERIDAIAIASPPRFHAPHTIAALEAGKHVFVEKPMALALRDAAKMRDAARRAGRLLMVGHLLRYHPAIHELRLLVDAGELGTVQRLLALRLGPSTTQNEEGPWWCLGSHDISLARFLFKGEILAVSARGQPQSDGVRDVTARLRFARGTAELRTSTSYHRKTRRLVLTGTRQCAIFDESGAGSTLSLMSQSCLEEFLGMPEGRQHSALTTLGRPVEVRTDEPLVLEAAHFVSALLDGTRIATDAVEGCHVVAVLEAGSASLSNDGAWISVADIATRRPRERWDEHPN